MTRVVAIADSDSYLKWSAATLEAMPAAWAREQWLIRSPIAPSPAQVAAATDRAVRRTAFAAAVVRLLRDPPDVVLLAATGPVVQVVLAVRRLRQGARRPVLVTGLPGISIPATEPALAFRAGCDLFVLHSHQEVTDFGRLAGRLGVEMSFGLATLPFIRQVRCAVSEQQAAEPQVAARPPQAARGPAPERIVFAAQAKVPAGSKDRLRLLHAFAALPPRRRVVIKLRAGTGEQQTHREQWPYPQLWQEIVAAERRSSDLVSFTGGSMAEALAGADGFVTVSSTAVLEAIGLGLPVLVLSDFGVSADMINEVFVGSGCLGTLADLAAGRLHRPRADWLQQNYFHPAVDNDWIDRITELVALRAEGRLPNRPLRTVDGNRSLWRRRIRLLAPRPLMRIIGRLSRSLRGLRSVRP